MVDLEQGDKIRAGPCQRQKNRRRWEGVSCRGNGKNQRKICGVVSEAPERLHLTSMRHVEKIGQNV